MGERKQVKEFIKKYRLREINARTLQKAMEMQGYTIVEFNGRYEQEDVGELIKLLDLDEYVRRSKGFTYHSDKYRLVFVNESLNEEERVIVLAHEEGHIWHDHMQRENRVGEDVIQEYEANEFAHYLLENRRPRQRNAKRIVIAAIVITLLTVTGFWCAERNGGTDAYTENFYVTQTGTKYHVKGCMYIRNKTDVRKMTREEYESGEYEPCRACLPEGK